MFKAKIGPKSLYGKELKKRKNRKIRLYDQ